MSKFFKSLLASPETFGKDAQAMDPMMGGGMADPMMGAMPGMDPGMQGPPPDTETQHELDFGQIAYAVLQDKAVALMPYLIGFEVVESSDDRDRSVGIFGFKVGETYYLIPVFFVNGQIKGMESIVNTKTNQFMPLRQSVVDEIVDRQSVVLGEGTDDSDSADRPDFDFLTDPPGIKSGSVVGTLFKLDKAWDRLCGSCAEALEKDAAFQTSFAGALGAVKGVSALEKTAEGSELVQWLCSRGGPGAVDALLKTAESDPKFLKAALKFYPDLKCLCPREFDAALAPKTAEEKVKVVVTTSEYDFDDEVKKKIVTKGYYVVDNRKDDEVSEDFDVDYDKDFENPTESGIRDVLMSNGRCVKAKLMMPADSGCEHAVVDVEGGTWFKADPNRLWIRKYDDTETSDESAADDAVALGDVETGKHYALVSPKGDVALVFEPRSVVAESGRRSRIMFNEPWRPEFESDGFSKSERRETRIDRIHDGNDLFPSHCERYLELANYDADSVCRDGDKIVVPANFKAVELATERESDDSVQPLVPGTISDLKEAMFKAGFSSLEVACDGGWFDTVFNGLRDKAGMSEKQAELRLVKAYGLRPGAAERILKSATDNYKCRRMLKTAQFVGLESPVFTEPGMTTDSYTGVPVQGPTQQAVDSQFTGVTPQQDTMQPGFGVKEPGLGADVSGLAEQAAAAGQKSVFDQAAVGGLSRLYDVDSYIDSAIPTMTKALDTLGRVLFLFRWKTEDFSDRYGSESIADLEDSLSNIFKQFGDLIVALKKKGVEGLRDGLGL